MKLNFFLVLGITGVLFLSNPLKAQNLDEDKYKDLFSPNSTLSSELEALKIKVAKFICVNIDERADTLYCKASKEDFIKNDIPEYFFHKINSDLHNVNAGIKAKWINASQVKKSIETIYKLHLKGIPTAGF